MNKKIPGGAGLLNPQVILEKELEMFPGAQVADLGCGGAAYFTLQSARTVTGEGVIYAVDVLKEILSNVEARAKMAGLTNVRTVWSNLEILGATKINDASLDFALVINVLFQNKQPEQILKEAVRMTKQSGRVLVVDWREGRFPIGPEPGHKVPLRRVQELAAGLGLREVKTFHAGQFHYGAIFEKVV